MLENRADSHTSGARFVGHGLEDSMICRRNASRHNKRFLEFQARHETNLKNESHHEKRRAKNNNQNRNDLPRTKTIKWQTLPYTASQPNLPKSDGLQKDIAKTPADISRKTLRKLPWPKNTGGQMNFAERLTAAQNLNW